MRSALPSLLIPFLVGCAAVGPDYRRATVEAPAQWSEPLAGGEADAAPPATAWWRTFADPELDALVERSVRANHDLRIAQARVRQARAQYGLAAAELGPTVDATAAYDRQRTSRHQPVLGSLPIPAGVPFDNDVYQAGFDASWEIDVFGGRRRSAEAAQAEVEAAEFARRAVLITVLGDVALNYLDVRSSQRRLAIAADNLAVQERTLAIARDRLANGLASDVDVEQAATLLSTTRATVPALDSALRVSVHRLGILLGQPPGALLAELSAPAPLPAAPPQVPVGLPSALLLRRPDVQRAERQLAAATARIGVARAELFPRFFLTGAAGLESVGTGDWFSSGSSFWSIGPAIQWRIFDTGRVRANLRLQDARLEEAQAAYERGILTAFEDVENALVAYAKEQTRRHQLAEAVGSSRTALRLASQLYANGLKDFLTVLDAERSLHQAEDQLVQSERAVSADLISLYKALGGGWQEVERDPALSLARAPASSR